MKNDGHNNSKTADLKRELSNLIDGGSIRNAYSTPQADNALKMLVNPGEFREWLQLFMRSDIPDHNDGASIRCIALSDIIQADIEFDCPDLIDEVMSLLALWPSRDGKRANMLVEAITGNLDNKRALRSNWQKQLQSFAFGNKQQEEQTNHS